MASRNYINFDLSIELNRDRYLARVLQSCAGEGQVVFDLPFSALELENFTLKIGQARRGGERSIRGSDSPELVAAKEFGARLFEAVFQGDVYACLRTSLEQAENREQGLRVLLRLPPELANLPWEYLYNPAWNQFFSLSVDTPLVRYLELTPPVHPLALNPPLRLLVVISSPSDYEPLDVEREWRDLQAALQPLVSRKLVEIDRLESASLLDLQHRLRRGTYHIFHFIGHGIFDERKQDGVLLFTDEHGLGRPLSGQDLGTLLRDHNSLRLALLNACEGARTGKDDPFAGAAHSLVQMGLPAVIAMQFKISDSAATLFAQEFYTALADGYGVDAALGDARKAIFSSRGSVEWGTPVMFSRTLDGRIFDLALPQTAVTAQPPPGTEMKSKLWIERLISWVLLHRRSATLASLTFIGLCAVIFTLVNNLWASGPLPAIIPSGTPDFTIQEAQRVTPEISSSRTPTLPPSATPEVIPAATSSLTPTVMPTITPTLPPGMVLIPSGPFQMGGYLNENEKPLHTVTLSTFLIDVYEVTNADYARCVTAGKCQLPPNKASVTRGDYYSNGQYANYPVINMTWSEADAYCKWRGARLPTEAEWEKAARGGLDGKQYPWGNTDPVCTLGVVNGAQYNSCILKDTTAVGSFGPNGYGLYDMVGNAWEWVNDWYSDSYYGSSSGNNPPGPTGGEYKVLRGGGWAPYLLDLRVALRYYGFSTYRGALIGFRCAVSVP